MCSINMVWTLIAGFLVMFMQAGFAMVETGLVPRQERRPHHRDEHDDLSAGLPRVLGLWLRDRLGQLVQRPVPPGWYRTLGPGLSMLNHGWASATIRARLGRIHVRTDRHQRLLPDRHGRRQRDGAVLLHDGVHGHHGHDSHRRDGRTLGWKNFCLYGLWVVAFPYCLFANWVWGGGWLAQRARTGASATGCRLRRLRRRARHGRRHWPGRCDRHRSAHRQVSSTASRRPSPATTCRWSSAARSSWRSAGSASTPARRCRARTCASAVVVVNTMLAGVAGALAAMCVMQLKS